MKAGRCFSQAVSSSFRSFLAALDLSVSSLSWRLSTAVKNWQPTWHHVTSPLTHWLPDRGARWGGSEGDYGGGVNNSVWLFIVTHSVCLGCPSGFDLPAGWLFPGGGGVSSGATANYKGGCGGVSASVKPKWPQQRDSIVTFSLSLLHFNLKFFY